MAVSSNGGGGGNQEDEEAVSCEGVVFTNAFRTTSVRSLSQRNLCKEMAFLTSFSEAKLTIAELSRLSAVRPRCLTTIFVGQMSSSRNKLPTTPFDAPCGKRPAQTANGSHMRSGIVPSSQKLGQRKIFIAWLCLNALYESFPQDEFQT